MKRRRPRKGVLSGIRYSTKSKKRRQSPVRKVVGWVGGSIVIAILLAMAVFMLLRMFDPDYGVYGGEGEFEVLELNPYDETSPAEAEGEAAAAPVETGEPTAVAEAIIEIQRTKMRIPLTSEQLETVQLGTRIHASYTIYPKWRVAEGVVIEEWWPAGSPRTGEPQAQ